MLGTDNSQLEAFVGKCNLTGSQFFSMDLAAVMRRCGGALKYVLRFFFSDCLVSVYHCNRESISNDRPNPEQVCRFQ